jgi:hypothetical protein
MAYSALPAKAAGDTITLTNYDAIKGNFEAGVPDIFTTKGDIAAATGADAAARLAVGADDATLVADSSTATGLAWQIMPAARVYNNAAIDPAPDGWVTLTFNSERYDTDAAHSTSSNTGRLTVPTGGGGLYHIGAGADFDTSGLGGTSTYVGLRILLNGTTVIAQTVVNGAPNGIDLALVVSCDYALSATNYVEAQVYTSEDINILATGNMSPEFWFHWFRRS